MKTISRYIMTLALLLTAVTGAWADGKVYDSSVNISTLQVGDILIEGAQITISNQTHDLQFMNGRYFLNDGTTPSISDYLCDQTATVGANGLMTGLNYGATTRPADAEGKEGNAWEVTAVTANSTQIVGITYAPNSPAAESVTVAWNASTKTGTFTMPGSDVVLTPLYAPAAKWDVVDNVEQLPAALEGVIADTDAPLIVEGTVAFAGQSNTVKQGTVMYAVTPATETEAPALDAANKWSADVPTAKLVADGGVDVLVWYYIKGADTPQDQTATAENTFNDSEPACLTITVLTNKFDIQFNAANANTIEAGKATVTVGGTDKTGDITEGKLQGVKMGSEVKMTAKDGYKFRKVEVKKKEAETLPALSITNPSVGQVIGSDGKNYTSGTLPTGVTAVAKICYVSGSNGLALALTDEEGTMNWSTAQTTCAAHTAPFTGGTWKLATKDEWDSMISAIGSYDDLREGFGFVGGTNMQSGIYWSSTEYEDDSSKAYYNDFYGGYYNVFSKGNNARVRACLAF